MREALLKKELWDMVRFTTINLDSAFKPIVEIHGLTIMQSRVLVAVKECNNATVGVVSKIIDVASPNGSSMCKKLEREGFIRRIRSIHDERVVTLVLTEKGEHTLEKISNDIMKRFGPILEMRTEEDFSQIIKGIKLLNELLKEFEVSKQ